MNLKRSLFIPFLLVVMVIAGLSGCTETEKPINLAQSVILIDESIVIPPVAGKESVVFYRGTIKNTAEQSIDELTISVKFYDEQDTFLGSKEDVLQNVKANEERYFQVSVSNADEFYQQIDYVDYEFLT